MSIERGRALVQGVMILIFGAIALLVSQPVGLGLVGLMGVLKLQESKTDWCPSDFVLKRLGLKKKSESAR